MHRLLGTFALAGMLVLPSPAEAQFTLGAGLAFHDDSDLGVGVFALAPLPSLHENVSISGDAILFFPDGYDHFELNGNLVYEFRSEDLPVTPFALGGLNVAFFSSEVESPGVDDSNVEFGLNVGGGVMFNAGGSGIQPVAGAKIELEGGEGFVLFGGIGFPLGGGGA